MAIRQYEYLILQNGEKINSVILNSKDKRLAFKKAERIVDGYDWQLSSPKMVRNKGNKNV